MTSQRDCDEAHLLNAAVDTHRGDPEFGYRFIADELAHERDIEAGEDRVQQLCSAQRLWSVHAKRRAWTVRSARRCPTISGAGVRRDPTQPAYGVPI